MKLLVINSDDFGMCHSVNVGILKGFREGILTQSTIMPPTPWFWEAIDMAKEFGIPVGVHLTMACDWDYLKYKPITGGRSLVQRDGSFFKTIEETREHGKPEEIEAELRAQIELVMSTGIKPTHIDVHMDIIDEELIIKLLREYGIHGRQPLNIKYKDCVYQLSLYGYGKNYYETSMPSEKKKEALVSFLRNIKHGFYFLCGHLSVPSDEIASVCSFKSMPNPWAQEYRSADLEVFTDPEIISLIQELGIRPISFDQVDINGNLLESPGGCETNL